MYEAISWGNTISRNDRSGAVSAAMFCCKDLHHQGAKRYEAISWGNTISRSGRSGAVSAAMFCCKDLHHQGAKRYEAIFFEETQFLAAVAVV